MHSISVNVLCVGELLQVYIAGATRARHTEAPCLRHASQAEQGSKLEALDGWGDSRLWG